jgi:hypothetical protein
MEDTGKKIKKEQYRKRQAVGHSIALSTVSN